MNQRQVQLFLALAGHGSLTRGAAAMGSSQPAASRMLRDLEADLGTRLFHRTGRGVNLTAAGETFLGYAQTLVETAAQAREALASHGGPAAGRVALAVTPMVGQAVTGRLLSAVAAAHPRLEVQVLEGNTAAIVNWLSSGQADLAVAYIPPAQLRDIATSEALFAEPLCLVSHGDADGPDCAIAFSALSGLPLALPTRTSGLRRHLDAMARLHRVTLHIQHEVDAFSTILGLVAAGQAFSIMPRLALAALAIDDSYHFRAIAEPRIQAHLSVHVTKQRPIGRGSRAVIEHLKTLVASFSASEAA